MSELRYPYSSDKSQYMGTLIGFILALTVESAIVILIVNLVVSNFGVRFVVSLLTIGFLLWFIYAQLLAPFRRSHKLRLDRGELRLSFGGQEWTIELGDIASCSEHEPPSVVDAGRPSYVEADMRLNAAFSRSGQVIIKLWESVHLQVNKQFVEVQSVLINLDDRQSFLTHIHKESSLVVGEIEPTVQASDAPHGIEVPFLREEQPGSSSRSAVLRVEGVSKEFSGRFALDDVSFSVGASQILGLIGKNGAGKTTALRCICGLLEPDNGEVTILDTRTTSGLGLGYSPDTPVLYSELTGREYLDFVGSIQGLDRDQIRSRIAIYSDIFGFSEILDFRLGAYSLGNRKKVGVCASMLHFPGLWVLDEPFNGLDPESMLNLSLLLAEYRDRGNAVLLSTHDLYLAERLCDEVVILEKGRVVHSGSVESIREQTDSASLFDAYSVITGWSSRDT